MRMDEPNFFKNEQSPDFGRDTQGRLLSPSEIMFSDEVSLHNVTKKLPNTFKETIDIEQGKVTEGVLYYKD